MSWGSPRDAIWTSLYSSLCYDQGLVYQRPEDVPWPHLQNVQTWNPKDTSQRINVSIFWGFSLHISEGRPRLVHYVMLRDDFDNYKDLGGLPQRSFQDILIWLNIRLRITSYQYPEFASKRYPIRHAVLWGSRYMLLLSRKAIVLKCFSQPSWLTIRMEEIWITRLKLNYNKLTLLPSHNFIKLYFIFYQINNFFDHLIKTV